MRVRAVAQGRWRDKETEAYLLDFVVGEMAPSIYNQAIADAQAYFVDKVSNLADVHNEAEFSYWKGR